MLQADSLPTETQGKPENTGVGNTGVEKGLSYSWDLPDPGIEPGSPALQVDSLPTEPSGKIAIVQETLFNPLQDKGQRGKGAVYVPTKRKHLNSASLCLPSRARVTYPVLPWPPLNPELFSGRHY